MKDTLLPTVAVVCPDPPDPDDSGQGVRRLLGFLDDWPTLVEPGDEVLLLVSLRRMADLSYLQLVSDVAGAVTDAGGSVVLGDSPWLTSGRVEEYWLATGLSRLAAARGWRLVSFERDNRGEVATQSRVYHLPESVLSADVLINIAPALSHRRCGLAAGIFNLLGCIPGHKPGQFPDSYGYRDVVSDVAVDLLSFVSPTLTIVDISPGSCCTAAGFDCRRRLIGSTDTVAVDTVAASTVGLAPGEPAAVRLAAEAGLGIGWLDGIELVGDPVYPLRLEDLAPFAVSPLEKLPSMLARLAGPLAGCRLKIDSSRCGPCDICRAVCPTGALRTNSGAGVIRSASLCVTCFRCREICPNGAITVGEKWLSGHM